MTSTTDSTDTTLTHSPAISNLELPITKNDTFITLIELFNSPRLHNSKNMHNYAQIRDENISSDNLRPKSPPVVMSVMECHSLLEKMLEAHDSKILFEAKVSISSIAKLLVKYHKNV